MIEPKYSRVVKGELSLRESGIIISRHKIVAGPDTVDGRGLVIGGDDPKKPLSGIRVRDCMVQSNGDDGCCIWGAVKKVKIERCQIIGKFQYPNFYDYRFVNKCFLAGADPDWPDPNYPDWFTVSDSILGGGYRSPKIRGGTFRFNTVTFYPSRRNELTRPRGDFVNCTFQTQINMRVQGGPNPYCDSEKEVVAPLLLVEPMPNSLYFKDCTHIILDRDGHVLSNQPASGPELCRLWFNEPVDPAVFRKEPN